MQGHPPALLSLSARVNAESPWAANAMFWTLEVYARVRLPSLAIPRLLFPSITTPIVVF